MVAQRGLSLVELMIGIAVGLFVVAASVMLTTTQLESNRRLLLETQIQQDLRAAADIVSRELRRAGSWAPQEPPVAANHARSAVWSPSAPAARNAYGDIVVGPSGVDFTYYRRPGEGDNPLMRFGFRLEDGRIRTLLAGGGWQDLTDRNVLTVTAFDITLEEDTLDTPLVCPNECAGGGTACWPKVIVRDLNITITGRAAYDATVERSIRTVVRVRNDLVQFNAGGQMCPA